jgi:uncharacterized protein (DUF924 family)
LLTIGQRGVRRRRAEESNVSSPQSWVDEVLSFWFDELKPEDWFVKDLALDQRIRERFLSLYERLRAAPGEALSSARAALATVIVLDQFPRNMFRATPQAFATDAQALRISEAAIAAGLDRKLDQNGRMFLYMPFQHSEDSAIQARSVELFARDGVAETMDFARQHKDIIDRFGRFPHRNAILGRSSTPEELEFLETHQGF